jgi:pyruvate dehydrogenase E2 component (dihydrolipoamide acetyltransferase)
VSGSGERGRIHAADLASLTATAPPRAAQTIDQQGLHLQWFTRGSDAPLVLLHGFGSELGSWRPLLAHLKGIPALGIDLPAHGKSPAIAVEGFDALAQALLARLDAESVGPLHLVGHSLGGGAALALAGLLGHRLRSLTLLAPAGFGPEIHGGFVQGLLRAQGEASLRPWLALLFGDDATRLDGSFVATAAQQLRSADRRAGMAALAEQLFPDGTQAESLRSRLGALDQVPTRIVWGAQDRIAPPHQADGLPGFVALHRLPGIGHLPQVEAAALLATLLRQQIAAGASMP